MLIVLTLKDFFLNIPSEILYYKNPVILNQQYSQDIIPGVYEGGFQLWECEVERRGECLSDGSIPWRAVVLKYLDC